MGLRSTKAARMAASSSPRGASFVVGGAFLYGSLLLAGCGPEAPGGATVQDVLGPDAPGQDAGAHDDSAQHDGAGADSAPMDIGADDAAPDTAASDADDSAMDDTADGAADAAGGDEEIAGGDTGPAPCVPTQPPTEVCDQLDNDCNGATDDGTSLCDDEDQCTVDTCDAQKGCVFVISEGLGCDDENPCTTGDTCSVVGDCDGAPVKCDDGDPCTTDKCSQSDGACKTAPANCDDLKVCTIDACDSKAGGCTHGPIAGCVDCKGDDVVPCSDGEECTKEFCIGSKCTWTSNAGCIGQVDFEVDQVAAGPPSGKAGSQIVVKAVLRNKGAPLGQPKLAQVQIYVVLALGESLKPGTTHTIHVQPLGTDLGQPKTLSMSTSIQIKVPAFSPDETAYDRICVHIVYPQEKFLTNNVKCGPFAWTPSGGGPPPP